MHDIPVYEKESNVPREIAGLMLVRAERIDALDPAEGWCFRYEMRGPGDEWVGASVYMYDRGQVVRGDSLSDRAREEYERSARSFAGLGEHGEHQDMHTLHAGHSTALAPQPDLDDYPWEDPGWWWSEYSYLADGEPLVTHLTLRVDAGLFQKVLYTYPTSCSAGRAGMMNFVEGWRHGLIAHINTPIQDPDASSAPAPADLSDDPEVAAVIRERAPNIAAALERFNGQLAENPRDVNVWKAKGMLYQAMGFSSQALSCYDKIIAVDPTNADAYAYMGQILASSGLTDEAHFCFTQALQHEPNHVEGWIGAGVLHFGAGETGKALDCYDRALTHDDASGKAWFMKALALDELGRDEEAQRCRSRAEALGFKG